jgi:hypothetical protein
LRLIGRLPMSGRSSAGWWAYGSRKQGAVHIPAYRTMISNRVAILKKSNT